VTSRGTKKEWGKGRPAIRQGPQRMDRERKGNGIFKDFKGQAEAGLDALRHEEPKVLEQKASGEFTTTHLTKYKRVRVAGGAG